MKKRKLVLADQVNDDLLEIWLYISLDSPKQADKFIDALYESCTQLINHPEAGRKRDELALNLFSILHKNYIIFYRITTDEIQIVRILNGYRDLNSIF